MHGRGWLHGRSQLTGAKPTPETSSFLNSIRFYCVIELEAAFRNVKALKGGSSPSFTLSGGSAVFRTFGFQ